MGDLSKHFSRYEFACRCKCGFDTIDYELIVVLEDVREHFGKPVTVNSASRCIKHNRSIGSKDTSQHPKSKAADIIIDGVNPSKVYNYLCEKYPNKYGIGKYKTFTHIDVRSQKSRW